MLLQQALQDVLMKILCARIYLFDSKIRQMFALCADEFPLTIRAILLRVLLYK